MQFQCYNMPKYTLIWDEYFNLPKMAYFCENDQKQHLGNLVK